ncbi:MAG: DUF4351 domain-containing protein [candidate division KSB1 bacterium]
MHELDHAIKKICHWHPNCVLDLFFGSNRTVELKRVEDAQIQIPEHRTDKIWRVREGEKEGALLLEAITEPDQRDFDKIELKNVATRINLKIPVVTVLVYLQRGRYATFPEGYEDEIGGLTTKHVFSRILLWEHAERIRSGELKELAPFLALFEDEPGIEVLQTENRLIEGVADTEQRMELKAVAAIVAARKFSEELIRQYLNLEITMIRETTIFSEWLTQSRGEGKLEGKNTLLLKLLEKKFGRLSSELKSAVEKLDAEQLDDLAMDIFDFNNIEDLRIRLHISAMSAATV